MKWKNISLILFCSIRKQRDVPSIIGNLRCAIMPYNNVLFYEQKFKYRYYIQRLRVILLLVAVLMQSIKFYSFYNTGLYITFVICGLIYTSLRGICFITTTTIPLNAFSITAALHQHRRRGSTHAAVVRRVAFAILLLLVWAQRIEKRDTNPALMWSLSE